MHTYISTYILKYRNVDIYISTYILKYRKIERRFVYSINNTLCSTYFLLIDCKTVLKLALPISAGYVSNFLEVDEKLLFFFSMSWGVNKEVVSSRVMFGFLMCSILETWLCVCWKSSDPFVCSGANCIKCTAVFSTKQTFILLQLGHRNPGENSAARGMLFHQRYRTKF